MSETGPETEERKRREDRWRAIDIVVTARPSSFFERTEALEDLFKDADRVLEWISRPTVSAGQPSSQVG